MGEIISPGSNLELMKGYWQVALAPDAKEKTAFSTTNGPLPVDNGLDGFYHCKKSCLRLTPSGGLAWKHEWSVPTSHNVTPVIGSSRLRAKGGAR